MLDDRIGDCQSRAELLADLLLALGERPGLLRVGDRVLVLVPGAGCELGGASFTPLAVERGSAPGLIPAGFGWREGRWTRTLTAWQRRPEPPEPVATERGDGLCRGQLLDAAGRPRAGLQALLEYEGRALREVRSDAEGRFALLAPPDASSWELALRQDGRLLAVWDGPLEACDLSPLRLEDGCTLAGRVSGPDGAPLAGAEVTLWLRGLGGGAWQEAGAVISDADGGFRLANACAGTWRLRARGRGFSSPACELPLAPGFAWAELRTATGCRIAGRTLAEDGRPLAGVLVESRGRRCRSAADGGYLLDSLDPGTHVPSFSASGCVPVRGKSVSLSWGGSATCDASLRLSGRLVVRVGASLAEGSPVAVEGVATGIGRKRCLPVREGRLRLDDLEPGLWRIRLEGPEGNAVRAEAVLQAGVETEVEADLHAPRGVAGRVLSATGAPLAGVLVIIEPEGGDTWRERCRTGTDGIFRLPVAGDGPWRLSTRAEGLRPLQRTLAEPGDGLDLRLDAGCTVTGTVRDAAGRPLAGAVVEVRSGRPRVEARSAEDGSYCIGGLDPGPVTLVARAADHLPASATAQLVLPGTTWEVQLERGLELAGRVAEADGRPLEGCRLVLADRSLALPATGGFRLGGCDGRPLDLRIEDADGPVLRRSGLQPGGPALELILPPRQQLGFLLREAVGATAAQVRLELGPAGEQARDIWGFTATGLRRLRLREGQAGCRIRRQDLLVQVSMPGRPVWRQLLAAEALPPDGGRIELLPPPDLPCAGRVQGAAGCWAVLKDPLRRVGPQRRRLDADGGFAFPAVLPPGPLALTIAEDENEARPLLREPVWPGGPALRRALPPRGRLHLRPDAAFRQLRLAPVAAPDQAWALRPADGLDLDLPAGAWEVRVATEEVLFPVLATVLVPAGSSATCAPVLQRRPLDLELPELAEGWVVLRALDAEVTIASWSAVRAHRAQVARSGTGPWLLECAAPAEEGTEPGWSQLIDPGPAESLVVRRPGREREFRLRDPVGLALRGAGLAVRSAGTPLDAPQASAASDETGRVLLRGLPPPPWDCLLSHQGRIALLAGRAEDGTELVLPPPCPPVIRLRASDPSWLALATALLRLPGGELLPAEVAGDGRLRWPEAPCPGPATLVITAPGLAAVLQPLLLPVAGEQVFDLQPAGRLRVTLGGPRPAGRRLHLTGPGGGALLRLAAPLGAWGAPIGEDAILRPTGLDGVSVLRGLAPGRYRVAVEDGPAAEVTVEAGGQAELRLEAGP